MSFLYKKVLLLFFINIVSCNMFGQACCSGGTPLSSSLGIQNIENKTIRFQLAYDYNTQQDLVSNSRKLNDDRRERNTHSILLRASFALSKKVSFTTLFSYVTQEEIVNTNFGKNFISASGVGDVALLIQYYLFSKNDIDFTIASGVKIPVGATDRIDDNFGIALNPDLQPGTGSYDYITGFNFTRSHIFKRNLTLLLISISRFTAPADRFGGQIKYEFGNELQNLFGFQDSYALRKVTLNPSVLFRHRLTSHDRSSDQQVPNTSGQWLHLVPGIDFLLNPNWSIGVSGEIPLYRNLNGTQLTTSYRLKITVDYQFTLKEK